MRCLKLKLEYDGTNFCGWQKQSGRSDRTVQGELEQALARLTGEKITVTGAGRTDAGVHAVGQVAGLTTACTIPIARFAAALNSCLPPDLVVREVQEVDEGFHARYDATAKEYCYLVLNQENPSAIWRNRCYHCRHRLDDQLIAEGARLLTGRHDFRAFSAAGSSVKTSERTIISFWMERSAEWLAFRVIGDGFLYRMVRLLVGTLLEIGRGKLPLEIIPELLAKGERGRGGAALPPQGLYLIKVYYPGDVWQNNPLPIYPPVGL